MTANLLTLNSSMTEFVLIGLKNQIAKIHNSLLDTCNSAWTLGFFFDDHVTFSNQITSLSKACYYHIRQLWESSTASTFAISVVHYELDYCNSLYYKLPKFQLSCLQLIQNFLAHIVVEAPKSCRITSILCSPYLVSNYEWRCIHIGLIRCSKIVFRPVDMACYKFSFYHQPLPDEDMHIKI